MNDELRSCTNRLKPFQQSAKSGNGTNRLSRIDRYFIIFGKAAGIIDPCQRTLNNPPFGQELPYRLDAHRNIDAKPQFTGNILLKGFAVSCISTKPLNRWIGLKCSFRSQNSCLGIMYIGSMNYHKSASDCGVIKVGHCCVWWKIVGQISPFASVIYEIQHSIYQFPFFPFAPVSCAGEQRLYNCPLTVAQIARLTASLVFLYHASTIAPLYHLDGDQQSFFGHHYTQNQFRHRRRPRAMRWTRSTRPFISSPEKRWKLSGKILLSPSKSK